MKSATWILGVFIALGLTIAGPSRAATRTVCFAIVVFDDIRSNCPAPTVPGVRRPCRADTYATNWDYLAGFEVEVWDKDDVGADDFIGSWVTHGGGGLNCLTFEWEGSVAFESTEVGTNPDVYIKLTNRVNRSSSAGQRWVDIADQNGVEYPTITWRNTVNAQYMNCPSGVTCTIDLDGVSGSPVIAHKPFNSTASNGAKALLAVDSAQRTLDVFASAMGSGTIMLEAPDTTVCPGGCAISRTLINLGSAAMTSGFAVAHELGHVIQMIHFEQDFFSGDPGCTNGSQPPAWGFSSIEWQSCATYEGWASYVGAASWYKPFDASTTPLVNDPGGTLGIVSLESPQPFSSTCTNNAWMPGQVAKAFWDADDVNNEAGVVDGDGDGTIDDDTTDVSTGGLTVLWDGFADGTSDGQDRESDNNGVNAWDYIQNAAGQVSIETLLHHNCLSSQDQN